MNHTDISNLKLQGLAGQFVGATDTYLSDLEEQIGFRLTDDYKGFLRTYGASLFGQDVRFRSLMPSPWAVDGRESFDVFYGMSEKPAFDLKRNNVRLRDVIPSRMIAIGHDPGSNLILLGADGGISFFDRETGQRFLCARKFTDFLNSFEPSDSKSP